MGDSLTDVPQLMEPHDMTWNDVDVVSMLEACMHMAGDSAQRTGGEVDHDELARRVCAAQEGEWTDQLASNSYWDMDLAGEEFSAWDYR